MPPSDLALLWAGDRTRSVDRDNVSMSHVSRLCVDAHLDQAVSAIPRTLKECKTSARPNSQPAGAYRNRSGRKSGSRQTELIALTPLWPRLNMPAMIDRRLRPNITRLAIVGPFLVVVSCSLLVVSRGVFGPVFS